MLAPLERRAIATGFCMALPDDYECQIRTRSGLALHHGVIVANTPATIDSSGRPTTSHITGLRQLDGRVALESLSFIGWVRRSCFR